MTLALDHRSMLIRSATIACVVALVACTPAQQTAFTTGAASAEATLHTACADAMAIANIAGLIPGVGAIVPYINAGCGTAEGIAKLAADPTSTQWVGQLIGKVQALASAVGLKL